jgi:hypothetical protein
LLLAVSTASAHGSHELPTGDYSVVGLEFQVDFNHVYRNGERLHPGHLTYWVKHKSQLKGNRALAKQWQYGVELSYLEDDLVTYSRLWLCKQCYLDRCTSDAKKVNGTRHMKDYMKDKHQIDVETGLMPVTPVRPASPWEAAAKVAGSRSLIAHAPWQEEAFQSAFIDWVILKDISFRVAVSPETQGLLTWNRAPLLRVLPDCRGTLCSYVLQYLDERMSEMRILLQAARSKISISVDIWTSSNHLSFLGVVAHHADDKKKPTPERLGHNLEL